MTIINEEERILHLVNIYVDRHNLRYGPGGEYVYQSDKAQEDALALVADIADVLAGDDR